MRRWARFATAGVALLAGATMLLAAWVSEGLGEEGDTGAPTVVIHDAHPGGAGIAELAFDAADRHLAATLDVLSTCRCTNGCPSCVQSPKCGNGNEPLDKAAARRLIAATLATAPGHQPDHEDGHDPAR